MLHSIISRKACIEAAFAQRIDKLTAITFQGGHHKLVCFAFKKQSLIQHLVETLSHHESRAHRYTHRSGHHLHGVAGRSQEVEEEEAGR